MKFRHAPVVLLSLSVLFSSGVAEAKQSKKKKKKETEESVEAAPATEKVREESAGSNSDQLIVAKSDAGVYLALGYGRGINGKVKVTKKTTIGSVSREDKGDLILAGSNTLTLELMQFNPGKMGFSLGAFYEQERPVTSIAFGEGETKSSLETKDLYFTQYGAQVNLLMSGDIPYGYIGANYGAAELKNKKEGVAKEDQAEPTKYKGELGGQIGIGVRIGHYLAIEGCYRITQFSKEDENLVAKSRWNMVGESAVVSVKLTLN